MMKHDFRWTPPAPEHHVTWDGPKDTPELEAILNSTYPGTWTTQLMPPEYPVEAIELIQDGVSRLIAQRDVPLVLDTNGPRFAGSHTLPYPVEWRQ